MIRPAIIFYSFVFIAAGLRAQESALETSPTPAPAASGTPLSSPTPTTTPAGPAATTIQKRGWLGRIFHPFSSSEVLPKYDNRKLRGLVLSLQVSPQPVRLSEVRQMEVKVTLINRGTRMINLEFPTDQRIEVQLLNPGDVVLTKWS